MRRSLIAGVVLLGLTACTGPRLPPPMPISGSEQVPYINGTVTGFVVDPQAWTCVPSSVCDRCVNTSKHAAELALGAQQGNGEWSVWKRRYEPGATVELCNPGIELRQLAMRP